jgi:hypothetical protein
MGGIKTVEKYDGRERAGKHGGRETSEKAG